ncbi:Conserved_hypothetical protein [Hexamita inflata]|uniref:Uncharacterized protein n=1 Tax=Hexamita inflata TaxID=28002 RepID=A0AA86QD09_9EUKA|nr:Conserved hypothetical protein [Hexamita inflata]
MKSIQSEKLNSGFNLLSSTETISLNDNVKLKSPQQNYSVKYSFKNHVIGRFASVKHMRVHVLGGFVLILFCYFTAIILYPKQNHYTIMEKTFSNLGSFDKESNYRGWYFYSLLQLVSFCVNFPMAFYQHRRLKPINITVSILACIGMVTGAVCQFFLCFFPASEQVLSGSLMWGDFHNNIGYLGFAGCLFGYVMYGVLSIIDRCKKKVLNHLKVDLAISFIIVMFLLTTTAICSWLIIYPKLKAKDPSMPSFRKASQYTIFDFTMWENLFVYSLYIFNLVFPFTLDFEEKMEKDQREELIK